MDLSPYKALVTKLVPLSYQHDLDGLLDSFLPGLDTQARFQIQAEIRRLTSPCLRVLDLRSLFPEQCRLFRHQGLDHMLPPRLEQRFQQLLDDYHGEYTRGLYEALIADLAALRKQPAMLNASPWHLPAFGTRRKETRLQFVTPVLLHGKDAKLQANSLNISVGGLLLHLGAPLTLADGTDILVSFPELAQQPGLDCLARPGRYQVIGGQERGEESNRLKLRRQEASEEWDKALHDFIEQKRPRYGSDAEDLYSTTLSQCWGQALLETGLGMSLFCDRQGGIREVLSNRFGNRLLEHWRLRDTGDLLASLLPPERIMRMAQNPAHPVLLYSFQLKGQQQAYYFAADQRQLADAGLYREFIAEGNRAGSLQLYYLNIRPVTFTDQVIESLDSQGVQRLQQLGWHLWLTPLPAPEYRPEGKANIRLLAPFLLQPQSRPVSLVPLRQPSLRQETRFRYETPVELELNGQRLPGRTEDISASGLKILLDAPLELALPARIALTLPELDKLGRAWKLRGLDYEVVNQSGGGKVLHLHLLGEPKTHVGFQFFSALLEQNQDKLRARPQSHHQPAWLMWLSRQAQQQPPSPTFLLGRNDSGFYVQGAIACLAQQGLMSFLSNEFQQAYLSRLISRQLMQSIATALHRPDGKSHLVVEIWTASHADGEGKSVLVVNPTPARQAELFDPGRYRQPRVSLAVVNRLQLRQLDFFIPEWQNLTQTALHKTQLLEQQLAELAALCQVFDLTDLALSRVRLSAPAASPAPLPG
jgi:hypothetical protein